jgi:hypothetical protein
MNQPMVGKKASLGVEPVSYSLRFPFSLGTQVRSRWLSDIPTWEFRNIVLTGHAARVEKRESYFVLWVEGFPTEKEAENFLNGLACGLIEWSSQKKAAIRFSAFPELILTSDDPHLWFRENLQPSEYGEWSRRQDGSITDGGIYAEQTCIIPTHKRIWEYPAFYGRIVIDFELQDLEATSHGQTTVPARALQDETFLLAIETFWTALDQLDRRVRFILLMTTLEILAQSQPGMEAPENLRTLTEELKSLIAKRREENVLKDRQQFERCIRKIEEITDTSISAKLRQFLCRVSGIDPAKATPERASLYKEVNGLYGIRSALAHGGKMRIREAKFWQSLSEGVSKLEQIVTTAIQFWASRPSDESLTQAES